MLKKVFSIFLVLTLAFSLMGCSQSENKKSSTIQLTDQAGRKVVLEEPADEIVSCYYISTYACLSLGLGDNIVGLEKKPETRPIYQMAQPSLLDLPQVGTLKELNIEAVAEIEPDLVIMPIKLQDNVESLEKLGINVLIVDPETHENLLKMIELIGQATAKEEQAEKLVSYYETKEVEMENLKNEKTVNVYMGSNSSYLETAPGTMYQSQLIETAGGNNVAKDLPGDYWTAVSYESLLEMNPDMIVIPCNATYDVDDILNDKQLSSLNAVVNKNVYRMPSGIEEWDSPVPSGILGTMWLASILHSEEYPFETFIKDVQDFYKTFYGFEIDTTLITK